MAQAKAGGEIGINGEFYAGGQFMANSPDTMKGMQNGAKAAKGVRKVQIEPYVWVEEREGFRPLFRRLGFHVTAQGGPARYNPDFNGRVMGWKLTQEEIKADAERIIEAWNRGERWEAV